MRKKTDYIFITIAILLLIVFLNFGRAFPSLFIKLDNPASSSKSLTMEKSLFFRQSLNNCAPYSVMAVLNILKKGHPDPEKLAQKTTWRIYKNLTYPQGLIDQLHSNGIKTEEFLLSALSDNEKTIWLKNRIDEGRPVILLIEVNHIKHYLTVIGYNEQGFMLYDSLQDKFTDNPRYTIVDNPELNGNRFYSQGSLLKLWNEGGYLIFFQNWALCCDID